MIRRLSILALLSCLLAPRAFAAATMAQQALNPMAATALQVTMLTGTCMYYFYNGDTATLWVGIDNTVTAVAPATPILASQPAAFAATYHAGIGNNSFWVFSTAGQTGVSSVMVSCTGP